MRQRGTLGLHEGLHALILATAGATVNIHSLVPEDSGAHAAEHPNDGIMACSGEANTMGACDSMTADRGDGCIGHGWGTT